MEPEALMGVFETLGDEERELILRHLDLVIKANEKVNLTRIDSYDEALTLHIEDSLLGLNAFNSAPDGLYGDMGTGAGYPGVPLAIATKRETILMDARKKKINMLDQMLDELEIGEQVGTYAGRAELFAKTQSKRFVVLTARALAKLSVLMELASPLLKSDGLLICYKAQLPDDELADARRVRKLVGMSLEDDQSYLLNGKYQRRIYVL